MDERIATNLLRWDEMAALHGATYLGEEAIPRDAVLAPFESAELGDLGGQTVCHLQCHIGGDSISLARLGATVTGIDFSAVAIEIAERRAAEAGVSDRVSFLCAAIHEVPDRVSAVFDGVYTSWGVLCWLPSLAEWATTIAGLLRPEGWFYLAETHPYAAAVRWREHAYGGAVAHLDTEQGDYTDDDAVFAHPEAWEWSHGLGDIVSALTSAGLRIDWLHEHPVVAWHLNDQEHMVRRPDGLWEAPDSTLPLSFSLRATSVL